MPPRAEPAAPGALNALCGTRSLVAVTANARSPIAAAVMAIAIAMTRMAAKRLYQHHNLIAANATIRVTLRTQRRVRVVVEHANIPVRPVMKGRNAGRR